MSCRIESVGDAAYRFCPDQVQPEGMRLRALVSAHVLDEITLLPVHTPAVSTPDRGLGLHVTARVAADGLVGLVGRPARLFPNLALAPSSVPMHIAAAGYLPLELEGTLGPIAGSPDSFAPLAHGDVLMHRPGLAIHGRVVRRGTPSNFALSGAAINIDGLWRVYPPPNVAPFAVMEPARIVALAPGLYGAPSAGLLARCDVVQDLAHAKRLLLPAPPRTRKLRLSDRQVLPSAGGMPLLIDPQDGARREVIELLSVDASFSDDQPAWIELAYPLKHLHRVGAQIVPLSIPATHDARTLARPGVCGDPVAFLDAADLWPEHALVRIDDGAHPLEYQWIEHYTAHADVDGYFRLPALSRAALVRLRATHASQPQPFFMIVEPAYGAAEQELSVGFE